MIMRFLVTGGNGFTGRHFIRAAQNAGHEVVALNANLTDAPAVTAAVKVAEPTHVVHLAAISSVTHADEAAFYQVNLFGTLNLLKALEQLPITPQKVMLASSANVYGNADVSPINESVCPKPVNHYAMSKLAMEHMAATYAEKLPIVFTRPFNYTGVGHDGRFVIPKIVDHFARGATSIELGNLDVEREYNDVRTVCQVYLALIDKGVPGEVYNVCSGRAVPLSQVLTLLEQITARSMAVYVNPAFVRANEVRTLSGCSDKLESCIGALNWPSLHETLMWMYQSGIEQK